MRWFVEISSFGHDSQPMKRLCVEAAQWQPALQRVRALRGDEGPLGNLSIELLDDGYRVIDPATGLRYLVKLAPDDAALSEGGGAKELPRFEPLYERKEDATPSSPLTYREAAYAVAPGTAEALADALLLDRFEALRSHLEVLQPGKLVQLAVFDHAYQGRPQGRPIATLSWKDWCGVEPELRHPLRDVSAAGTSPSKPPEAAAKAAPLPEKAAPPAPEEEVSPAPAPPPAPTRKATPASAARRPPAQAAAKTGPRLSGDDLIAELFEACVDLAFLGDALEAAGFVLGLTLEKIPSAVGLVSLFDVNKRELVVIRQVGGEGALLARLSDRAPLVQAAMRSKRAIVIADAKTDRRAADDRWKATGVELRSVIVAPVELAGRTLGLIELANPLDGGRYTEGDGNALTYIGQQLAEFVATHGVVLDPELVLAAARDRAAKGSG